MKKLAPQISLGLLIIIFNSCGIFIKRPQEYHIKKVSNQNIYKNVFTYNDGYKNFISPVIIPESKNIVLCIPGLGAHSGTYKNLQDFFLSNKISTVSIDLRGFGHHSQEKGDIKNIGIHLSDIDQVVNYLKSKYPQSKVFLLGESLGASLSIRYNSLNPNKISGLILTSLVTNKGENKVKFKTITSLLLGYCFSPKKPIDLGYNTDLYCNDTVFNNWAFKTDTLGTNSISVRYLVQANKVIKESRKQICQQKIYY